MSQIGELNEQPLHASLKAWYTEPGARVEVSVDGFVVDIVHEGQLIEIQTSNFSGIKNKMRALAASHPVRLVYPIAREKWLLKLPKTDWDEPRRRKSPKRGRVEDVFRELVSFPDLVIQENFVLEVVLINEEEVRRFTGRKMWWRNGWEPVERRLLSVEERKLFRSSSDLETLLPRELPREFTTKDLAQALDEPRWLAQKMAYCLRKTGVIETIGKRGRSHLYVRNRVD